MLGSEAIGKCASGGERGSEQDRAGAAHGNVRRVSGRKLRELFCDFGLHSAGEFTRWGDEEAASVGGVLGLGKKVGGDELGIAGRSKNDRFGRASGEVD